jgi:hypothetical protein
MKKAYFQFAKWVLPGILIYIIISNSVLAQIFEKGDIFLAVGGDTLPSQVDWYREDGTFVATLWDSISSGFTTGIEFNSDGNLFVTNFIALSVSKYNNDGTFIDFFGSGHTNPESITFDTLGRVYIGNVFGGLHRFLPDGTFDKIIVSGRVDFTDIDVSNDTILYTQESSDIRRVVISDGSDPGNFTTGTATQAFAIKILTGARSGKVLLADLENVKLFRADGTVERTYDMPGEDSWFSLNLSYDDSTFWSGNFDSGIAYKFAIDSGNMIRFLDSGKGSNRLYGIAIFDEITPIGVKEKEGEKLTIFSNYLEQNHPNPFSKLTVISYQISSPNPASSIPHASPSGGNYVSLSIYDLTGRLVKTLVNEVQEPGVYQVYWDGRIPESGVRSGIFFYRLKAGDFSETKKMILLK